MLYLYEAENLEICNVGKVFFRLGFVRLLTYLDLRHIHRGAFYLCAFKISIYVDEERI